MYWHIAAVASMAWTLDGCGKKKGDLFWPYLVSVQVVAGFRVLPEGKRSEAVEPSKGEFTDCVSDVFRRLTLCLSYRMGGCCVRELFLGFRRATPSAYDAHAEGALFRVRDLVVVSGSHHFLPQLYNLKQYVYAGPGLLIELWYFRHTST